MKRSKILLAFSFLAVFHADAQFRIAASAGINNTSIDVKKTRAGLDKYGTGLGWFAGAQVEYVDPDNIILYAGANLLTYNHTHDQLEMADARIFHRYRPVFVNIPAGIGFGLPLFRNIPVNLYLGGYLNIGAGGSHKKETYGFYPAYSFHSSTQKIKYGNQSADHDFRPANWGFQPAISIGVYKNWQLHISYQLGVSNILPKDIRMYEDQRLRSFSAGLKYQFKSQKKAGKNLPDKKKAF
jgi:hypothetical protein